MIRQLYSIHTIVLSLLPDIVKLSKGDIDMPFKLGPMELVLILVIVLVIFGVGRLPQIGSALGKTMKAFKSGQVEEDEEEEEEEAAPVKTRKKPAKKTTRA
jgi:sec-independent protein translocase protein TatA